MNLPEEARGWLLLNRCGLSKEQKAVVLARANGKLQREEIGFALRSCPEMILRTRRSSAVHLVDEEGGYPRDAEAEPEIEFQDIEQFLAEHGHQADAFPSGNDESFHEDDVAECLAVTWKERRINRLQKARKFQQVKELKRQFRVEVEEIKRKSKWHKCQRQGHWARERPFKGGNASSASTTRSPGSRVSAKTGTTGAACVQSLSEPEVHFVAAVASMANSDSLLERNRALVSSRPVQDHPDVPQVVSGRETLLLSSPGYGVLDSGCGKTMIGEETLTQFQQLWSDQGLKAPPIEHEVNHSGLGMASMKFHSNVCACPFTLETVVV